MRKLTATQLRVIQALKDASWMTPLEVAKTACDGNASGAAASLRVLVDRGLVERRDVDRPSRWALQEYRKMCQ